MVTKVSSLLKTVKNVEDEAGRGVRSLENTIDSIDADLEEYNSPRPPKATASPEDLIRSTKGITLGSAKVRAAVWLVLTWWSVVSSVIYTSRAHDTHTRTHARTHTHTHTHCTHTHTHILHAHAHTRTQAVSAGNSCRQVDVTACANLGRKAVSELLLNCKAAAVANATNEEDRHR